MQSFNLALKDENSNKSSTKTVSHKCVRLALAKVKLHLGLGPKLVPIVDGHEVVGHLCSHGFNSASILSINCSVVVTFRLAF